MSGVLDERFQQLPFALPNVEVSHQLTQTRCDLLVPAGATNEVGGHALESGAQMFTDLSDRLESFGAGPQKLEGSRESLAGVGVRVSERGPIHVRPDDVLHLIDRRTSPVHQPAVVADAVTSDSESPAVTTSRRPPPEEPFPDQSSRSPSATL